MVVNRLLKGGAKVSLTKPEAGGVPYVVGSRQTRRVETRPSKASTCVPGATAATARCSPPRSTLPRMGIYQSYDPSMDEGWTRWVLDHYEFEYTKLHNEDIKPGRLRQRFDAIILPDQRGASILNGLDYKTIVEEYRGGIGDDGLGWPCGNSSPRAAR